MAEFEHVEPFDIDDGELDGLTPQEAFVLGVEWHMVLIQSRADEPFEMPMHSRNKDRIEALLRRMDRVFTLVYMREDVSENWMHLIVEGQ
jgi:hypothetical protein